MIRENGADFQLKPFLSPLVRYRWLIVTFCVSAILSSLTLTYVISEKYRAAATLLYQPRETVSFQPKVRDALGFPLPLVPLESIVNTLEAIVKSDALLEQTVQTLRLHEKGEKPAANWFVTMFRDTKDRVKELRQELWQILKYGRVLPKDPVRGAIGDLRANLTAKRTNKAYTFQLEVLDSDPQRAARIATTVGELLSEFVLREQTRGAREAREKIEPRLLQASEEVRQIREDLERFKQQMEISSLDEELSLRLKSVNDFEQELAEVRNAVQSLESRRAELAAQLDVQERSVKYLSTITDNPVFNDLRLEQSRLEVERSGLLEKFTPQHQEVKAVDAKLAEVRERLKREEPKLLSSESSRLNDIFQKVTTDKLTVEAEIQTLRAKELALARTLAQETARTRKLTESEPRLAQITLQLKAGERSYQLIKEAYEEARLAESKTVSEVTLQQPAFVPHEPARPIKIVHVGVTFLLSLVFAIGFVFLINFFDSTIRDIEEAELVLGLPVLATIPAVDSSEATLAKL